MATTPLDINGARTWLDQNLGGSYGANGQFQPGSVFNNGVYDVGNGTAPSDMRNTSVLGKAQQMGYSPDQVSQILGIPASQITSFMQSHQPQINSQASVFQHDATAPAPYMVQGGGLGIGGGPPGAHPQGAGQPGPIGGSGGVMGTMGGAAGGVANMYPGQNPYLGQMAQGITRQVNNNLQRNVIPGIRSDAVAMGGVGSSREGIADGLAMGDASKYLSDSLGNLYGTDYTNQANRNLSQYGMDQNFYTSQRGQDLAQLGLGANIYSMGQQNGWNGLNSASNIFNNAAGQTTTGNNSNQQGGGAMGAFGGALGGAQLANNLTNPNYGGYNLGF